MRSPAFRRGKNHDGSDRTGGPAGVTGHTSPRRWTPVRGWFERQDLRFGTHEDSGPYTDADAEAPQQMSGVNPMSLVRDHSRSGQHYLTGVPTM